MTKYLISFRSAAMVVPDGELQALSRDAHAVIAKAKAAGVYVFGGGDQESRVRQHVPLRNRVRRAQAIIHQISSRG